MLFLFFNDTATTEIYTYGHTLSLHDALPIYRARAPQGAPRAAGATAAVIERDVPLRALAVFAHPDDPEVSCGGTLARWTRGGSRSEEHTSELQSLMRISYAVFCLKKKNN